MSSSQNDAGNTGDTGNTGSESSQERTPTVEELEERLADTRADLGDTVEALSGKLDVGSRVRTRAGHTRDAAVGRARSLQSGAQDFATDSTGSPRTDLVVGAAVAVVLVTATVVLVRRRQR